MSKYKLKNSIIENYGIPAEAWPDIQFPDMQTIDNSPKGKLLKKKIGIYNARKKAFDEYFAGTPIKDIVYKNEQGESQRLSPAELNRWLNRSISQTEDGHIYGYSALIPYNHIQPYIRGKQYQTDNKTKGQSGIFTDFLKSHPEIEKMIRDEYLLGGTGEVKTKGIKGCKIYKNMIRMCKKMGLYNEYPLDRYELNKETGKRALYNYLKKLRESQYTLYAQNNLTEDAVILSTTTGNGQKNNPLPVDIFQVIEIDEHTVDGKFIVSLLSYEGDEFIKEVDSITLIVGVDINTKAILGYYLVPGKSTTSEDIKRCIINCIHPHRRIKFNIPGFKYPADVCFTSEVGPEMVWATVGEIKFDNHMTHKSIEIRRFIEEDLGIHVNFGAIRTPTRRSTIEKTFDILENITFHQLPNTTGGSITSPLRNNPENQAVKYQMTFNQAKQIAELGVAHYNLISKTGNYNMSPIQTIRNRISAGRIPKTLEPSRYEKATIITRTVTVDVLGDLEKGRNPYVNYQYARYTSSKLAQMKSLLHQKITLVINIDDARYAKAYTNKGEFIDTLTANGKWGVIEHTLKLRNALCSLRSTGEIDFTDSEDFIDIYKNYLAKFNDQKVVSDFIEDIDEEVAITNAAKEVRIFKKRADDITIDAFLQPANTLNNSDFTEQQRQNIAKFKCCDLFDKLIQDMNQ